MRARAPHVIKIDSAARNARHYERFPGAPTDECNPAVPFDESSVKLISPLVHFDAHYRAAAARRHAASARFEMARRRAADAIPSTE